MSVQVESVTRHEPLAEPGARSKITLRNDHLKAAQQLHALAIFFLPLLGVAAAIAAGPRLGVGAPEAALLGTMYVLTMYVGITVGFHRGLSHRAFQAGGAVRAVLAVLGSMAAQGPPLYWASNHRRHHSFSDQPGDPHSPYFKDDRPLGGLRGLWHAHAGWTFDHELTNAAFFSRDLLRDPVVMAVNRLYFVWVFAGLAIPAAVGGLVAGTWMGALWGVLWGGLVRLFLTYHVTNSVNSITHMYGSRPFDTREQSRNNPWLAIPTGGEAWHNNHHAFPTSARFGLWWWQVDLGYVIVRALELVGLIRSVKVPTDDAIEARRMPKAAR